MVKRIEKRESQTAEMTCLTRTLSFYEKNELLKSDDYIAPEIVPPAKLRLVKMVRSLVMKMVAQAGLYEYVIARTKYIDAIFSNLDASIEQVVILGAGFDSRSIRFQEQLKNAKVYEVDAPTTQSAKVNQFQKRAIQVPENLRYVPVDFEKDTFIQKMREAGFHNGRKNLFLLEGLTMYLDDASINLTFSIINEVSGPESLVIFDYIIASVLRGESDCYGGREAVSRVAKAGEPWTFGIEEDQVDAFLARYQLSKIDESGSEELERRFFTETDGNRICQVNAAHRIVTARKIESE